MIDIYSHITTEKYRNALMKHAPKSAIGGKMVAGIPTLWDLDARFRIMDKYVGYRQVIVTSGGYPIEALAKGRDAAELARLANDEAAELVSKYPSRFVGAVATLPLDDTEAALKELDRAINELKLKGLVIYTPLYFTGKTPPAGGKPLDLPGLMPIYEKMAEYDLPIWIHPNPLCDLRIPDYTSESEAKYFAWQIFGWPYQDTLAQVRLIFSGVLEKYPNLKIINHHGGALVPFLEKRIEGMYNMAEKRVGLSFTKGLSKKPLYYFRMFYNDTATDGSTPGLMCAYAFYGAKHLLFGTDMPFDQDLGDEAIRNIIRAVEQMNIPAEDKRDIFEGNARRLLHLD